MTSRRLALLAATAPLALIAAPAFAQENPAQAPAVPGANPVPQQPGSSDGTSQAPADQAGSGDIIVTGSLVRNPATATASPVTSLSAGDISRRGITTVAEAIQMLPANNQGTAPPSWSSYGFATGASAPSLRGLNDAYTLTLFNGLRSAPYPLGDDGYRNFVDINTIPSSIVDRIDVLQDGASATYGSDAIAGVVNVIVKREVQGIHANVSSGISQRGDSGDRYASLTAGYGDLSTQHFNVYVNGEYQYTEGVSLADRGGLAGTANQSSVCGPNSVNGSNCLANGIRNGIQANGSYAGFATTISPAVRAYNGAPLTLVDPGGVAHTYAAGTVALGSYAYSNGCGGLNSTTLTAAQRPVINPYTAVRDANGNITGYTFNGVATPQATAPGTVCQQDLVNDYSQYSSPTERYGANIRATVRLGNDIEAYAMFNYYNVRTENTITPYGYTGATTPGAPTVTVSQILLPVYVCPQGIGALTASNQLIGTGCTAANGTLNPNNPFAAQGQLARVAALSQIPRSTTADAETFRFSGGVTGSFSGVNFNLQATSSSVILNRETNGYIYAQSLFNAVAQGTYNFLNPQLNTPAQTAALYPTNFNHSTSHLTEVMLTLDRDLFQLPGGSVNFAVSGQYRHESISNPSSNPAGASPTDRYFAINAVGVEGSRNVYSGAFQLTMPIFTQLNLKAEGSYDHYSTGQSRFSPKFEARFTPIREVTFRGTYSRGFRIPSFSESFALPTTGYVSGQIVCTNPVYTAFCNAHASNPAYYNQGGVYSYGLTSGGNLNLKPERSENITAGIILQPTRRFAITADFWQIRLKDTIVGVSSTSAPPALYYTNGGVSTVPGVTFIPAVADPLNPNAQPLLGQIVGSYTNADSYLARGIDVSINGSVPIGHNGLTWRTNASASYLLRLEQTDNGNVLRYDNSLGACNITSCSGAPRFRAVWLNTLEFGDRGSISLTANYTSGFSEVATDSGGTYGDCAQSAFDGQIVSFPDGSPVICRERSTFYMDGHAEVRVADHFTFYFDVKNIFDRHADYTPNAAYGLYQFNPAWQDSLFIGRFFRAGARVDF